MKINEAKRIVKRWLLENNFNNRVSGKTIDFADLTRRECIFIKIHDWVGNPIWKELKELAHNNGFCVEA